MSSNTDQPKSSTECNSKDEKCEDIDSDDAETEITEEMVKGDTFRAEQGKQAPEERHAKQDRRTNERANELHTPACSSMHQHALAHASAS